MRWPWKKSPVKPRGSSTLDGPWPHWPEIVRLTGIHDLPPRPDDVLPDAVTSYIWGIELLAIKLRAAAEAHYIRRHTPGYKNRAWRKMIHRTGLKKLWETPIEYTTGNPRGITALTSKR